MIPTLQLGGLGRITRPDFTNDPFLESVTALLHFDGANGSTTMTEQTGKSSWTAQGTASLSTAGPKFGTACLAPGTRGILSASDVDLQFGTGDFTVEFFYLRGSVSGGRILFDTRSSAGSGSFAIYTSGTSLRFFAAGADRILGSAISSGVYDHIAVSRISGTARLFLNGAQTGGSYADNNNYSEMVCSLGYQYYNNTGESGGAYDELRVTKGVGRYHANFTVPTSAYPNF